MLFGDIANYTALAEKLDPEEVHRIIQRCFELVTAEIHRFEGTINQYGGDGFMALFGAPVAHEDAPRRAVHAALAIQRALDAFGRELERERGLVVRMRIGINTGLVVVGRIADDLRMEYTAIGDTINLASRLQAAARPGSVVVSEATFRAIEGFFDTVDLGELAIKGHAPVRAFEVTGARARRTRLQVTAERGLTPLVGRDRELQTLAELFGEVKACRGQVAFIAGEAGIGKSRTLLEFRRHLESGGERFTWLEGRCVSFGQSTPLLPIIDQLRDNFGIDEGDGESEVIAKVERGMRAMQGLEAEIPYIRYVLSADPGDPAITAMDAAERRKRLFDALRAMMLRGAALRPIIFVFEDIHWTDTSTRDYLDYVMDSVAGARVMMILTHRIGLSKPFAPRTFHTNLNLRHLSESQMLEMAARVLGSAEFPPELRAALEEKAEGVPLFVEEMTKSLLDLGILVRENGSLKMARSLGELSVPETMQDIIMARLDRLGDEGRRTVQLASVIGRQFLARLLERVAGLTGRLDGLLRELKSLEIIYELGLLPEPAYIFKHAVIQDVAYQSLLVQRRKELHRAVGEAIEELYRDRLSEHYPELAHHFIHGEHWAKAVHYCTLAGDQAAHAFANVEAEQHYSRALEAASKLPSLDPAVVADLHANLGAVLNTIGRHDEAVAAYNRGRDAARSAGDRRREIRILLGLTGVYFNAHRSAPLFEHVEEALRMARESGDKDLEAACIARRIFPTASCHGVSDELRREAEEAVRLASFSDDPRVAADAHVGLGTVLQWRGDYDASLESLRKAGSLARQSHYGWGIGLSLFQTGMAQMSRGEHEAALATYRQMLEYAEGAGDRFFLARAPNLIGGVHMELFDLDHALELNLEGAETAVRLSPWPDPRAHSLTKAGAIHVQRGELGTAEKLLLEAWELLERDEFTRWRWQIPLLHARGQLALARGHREDAWSFATQSLDLAASTVSRKHIARAQWLQGEILVADGKFEEAARSFEQSADLAQKIGTPREHWMAAAALGRVLIRLGRDDDAQAQFERAAERLDAIATQLTTPKLRQAFVDGEPVLEIYRLLGRRPPPAKAPEPHRQAG